MVSGHDCGGPARVVLHDAPANTLDLPSEILGESTTDNSVGIPVFGDGVTVHERKDGPMSISRRAEVSFPLTGLGEDWIDYVNAFSEGGGMQRATVWLDLYRILNGNHMQSVTPNGLKTMTGYIGAVGADGSNTGNLTIFGPYNLLGGIPVGVTINPSGGLHSILDWFTYRFGQGQRLFDEPDYDIIGIDDFTLPSPAGMSNKSFTANRDTMVDVVKWLQEEFGVRLWFEPHLETQGEVILKAELLEEQKEEFFEYDLFRNVDGPVDLTATTTYDATTDGGVDLIHNNALYEMKPYNTLVLRGEEKHAPPDPEDILLDTSMAGATPRPTGRYPETRARYPALVERAGGELPVVRDSPKSDQAELESAARHQLKEALDTVSGGTMELVLSPVISPHDRIVAQPACATIIDADLPELTYEVQRTAHTVNPNHENGEVYKTEVAVSMGILAENIEVETTMKTIEPSVDADNKPSEVGREFDAITYQSG